MQFRHFTDPSAFRAHVEAVLMEQEAVNNLPLGVLSRLVLEEKAGGPYFLASVDEGDKPLLVMMKTTHRYTLPIGLLFFDNSQGQETCLLMAAITMSVVPMILIFVFLQRHLVRGIQLGAVKG